LSIAELVRDINVAGGRARHVPKADGIVQTIAAEASDGDVVIVMSNGGFEGIHGKLLTALSARA